MPFDISFEEGERLIANFSFVVPRDSAAFHIAITDRAVFLPRKKFFAVKDPTYYERVSLNRVVEAKIKRLSPFFLWTLALLMVVAGTVTTVLMALPVLRGEGGQLSGYPPAALIVGLVIPFIARRRYGLSISVVDQAFLWKPRLHVDRVSRNALEIFLTQVAEALRQAGVNVKDERDSSSSASNNVGKASPYPVAMGSDSFGSRGVLRACYRCGKPLRIRRWDDWNGFLFRCPHCEGIHGRPWRAYMILLASVLLNGISFFFTLRWRWALPLFLGFTVLAGFVGFALDRGQLSETLKLALLSAVFLGPLAINSVLLLQHEMALKTASVIGTKPSA
jgi:hypothetical protein